MQPQPALLVFSSWLSAASSTVIQVGVPGGVSEVGLCQSLPPPIEWVCALQAQCYQTPQVWSSQDDPSFSKWWGSGSGWRQEPSAASSVVDREQAAPRRAPSDGWAPPVDDTDAVRSQHHGPSPPPPRCRSVLATHREEVRLPVIVISDRRVSLHRTVTPRRNRQKQSGGPSECSGSSWKTSFAHLGGHHRGRHAGTPPRPRQRARPCARACATVQQDQSQAHDELNTSTRMRWPRTIHQVRLEFAGHPAASAADGVIANIY